MESSGPRRSQPPGPPRGWRRRSVRTRWVAAVVLLVVVVCLGWLGDSVGRALTAPGSDSVSARLAEWGRFHHLGVVVTGLEKIHYDLSKPRTGGAPAGGVPSAGTNTQASPARAAGGLPAPAPVSAQVSPALAGEGGWQTVSMVHGQPALREAFVRPDASHTSYLAGIAWMDPTLLRFTLHPGTQVPGGSGWGQPPLISGAALSGLVATFNSGFTMQDARGGYWESGKQAGQLRVGAAALVIDAGGRPDVVSWPAGPVPTGVVAVRQNLDLLVTGGALAAGIDSNSTSKWGKTLGNRAFVWRSALGVTKTGALVYVAGNALSTRTLGQLEVSAGAVRAMELDINPEWTSFMSYTTGTAGAAVPRKLTADEQGSARRYLRTSTRDFVAAEAR